MGNDSGVEQTVVRPNYEAFYETYYICFEMNRR